MQSTEAARPWRGRVLNHMAWLQDALLQMAEEISPPKKTLPSLLFTWLPRLLLLGCRLQVQQHAKQPTLCSCQGTRLLTTENSQGPTGAVAKHKGNLVSKVNSMLFQVCLKFSAPPVLWLLDTILAMQKALSNRHTDARPSLSQKTIVFIKCCCLWMLLKHISVIILRNWVKVPLAIS